MDKSFGPLILWALAMATIIGVVFRQAYPETGIDAGLGMLFALAGLLLVLLLRTSWRALHRRDR